MNEQESLRERLEAKRNPKAKLPFHDSVEKTELHYEFTPHVFNKVVYIECQQNVHVCSYLKISEKEGHGDSHMIDDTLAHRNTTKTFGIAVSRKFYETQIAEYKKDPVWILQLNNEREIRPYTDEFLQAYQAGKAHEIDYKDRANKKHPLDLLKEGREYLFCLDRTGYDGHVTDLDGQPIRRAYWCDYIANKLNRANYRLKPLLEHMQTLSFIKEPEIFDIPYYNSDEGNGGKAIQFYFDPDEETFRKIVNLDDYRRKEVFYELIGTEKFKKENDE